MRTYFCLVMLIASTCTGLYAQHLNAEQVTFLNATYDSISGALPKAYKNWRMDSLDYFQPGAAAQDSLMGRSAFYTVICKRVYAMKPMELAIFRRHTLVAVNDFTNKDSLAHYQKIMAGTKVEITVMTNIGNSVSEAAAVTLHYCAGTTPEKIEVPVNTKLAVLGLQPASCPVMNDYDLTSFNLNYKFGDEALIFWGTDIGDKKTPSSKNGALEDHYDVRIDRSKISTLVNQNILIIIKGNRPDIEEMIRLIDWKALTSIVTP